MRKRSHFFLIGLVAFAVMIVIAFFILNRIFKNKVESFLSTGLPAHFIESHKDLSIDFFNGNIALENTKIKIRNKDTTSVHTFFKVKKLIIEDISYWDYLFNNELNIEKIQLKNPTIHYYKDRLVQTRLIASQQDSTVQPRLIASQKGKKKEPIMPIFIQKLSIENTNFSIFDKTEDSIFLYAKNLSLEVSNIRLDEHTVSRKIPMEFGDYSASADSLFVKTSSYENLMVSGFLLENKNASFYDLKLQTKYSKSELSQMIKKERDHFDVSLDSLSVKNVDFGFMNKQLFIDGEQVNLHRPRAKIFRDKLVADDPTIKKLYSQMLRELPFQLTVASVKINDAFIEYSEKVKPESPAGTIVFSNLNADIHNASNTYVAPKKTEINIDAIFMERTPISVAWDFNVQNLADKFVFKAETGAMQADEMNRFTESNLNVRLVGEVLKTYFTINGNRNNSSIDLKLNYRDFKVTVLQKDGREKNKLLSAIVNLFVVKKESKQKDDFYREGTAETTRDKTKSVFNFLWLNVRDGLLSALTSGGNKN